MALEVNQCLEFEADCSTSVAELVVEALPKRENINFANDEIIHKTQQKKRLTKPPPGGKGGPPFQFGGCAIRGGGGGCTGFGAAIAFIGPWFRSNIEN